MSLASRLPEDYQRRTGVPRDLALDGHYAYQWAVLRDLLSRLEVILDDEGIPRETAERVLRCLLYGSPSPADAEQRMRQQDEMVKLLSEQPVTVTVHPDRIHQDAVLAALAGKARAAASQARRTL